MKICLAGDCQNKHHSLYNMYMYICINIIYYNSYIYYKYHNLILNILIINDNNLFWLLALLLLLCLLLTLVLFLLLMTNTTTLAMIKIIDTQKSKKKHQQQSPYSCQEHQPKCSHRCESRRFRIFTDMHHLRRVRRVARLHNCWGRPTPKTTRIRSIIPSTIEFKHACSMSPRLRSSIGLFINSRDCINSIIRRDPAGMDKFHLSAELLSAFLATLWGAASASSSHLWMHFCQGHPQ